MSEQVLGVVFGGTEKELLFLPFSDVECSHKRYHSLQEILEIAEDFNRQYNNKHIRWSVPTLAEWNAIIRNLEKMDVFGKSAPDMCDRTQDWGELRPIRCLTTERKMTMYYD